MNKIHTFFNNVAFAKYNIFTLDYTAIIPDLPWIDEFTIKRHDYGTLVGETVFQGDGIRLDNTYLTHADPI